MRIGWIGTGVMGAPMAGHLMAGGHSLTVYSRTKAKAERLLAKGAAWAESPAEVAAASEVVFTLVGFPADVHETYFGEKGVFKSFGPGKVAVDMTTSPPELAEQVAREAERLGGVALDAPVSGGQSGAENAKLTIMVGGDCKAFERLLPVFELMGKTVNWMGPAGSGQHTKVVNQILIAGNIVAIGEALSYARASGINPERALDAVSHGAAASWQLLNLGPRMLKEDFAAGFYIEHFVKDLGIALGEARRLNLPLPMVALAQQLYVALQAQGHGRLGTQAILKLYDTLRGIPTK